MKKILLIAMVGSLFLFGRELSLTQKRLNHAVKTIKKAYGITFTNKICTDDNFCQIMEKTDDPDRANTINFKHMYVDILPNPYGSSNTYKAMSSGVLMSLAKVNKTTAERTIVQLLNQTASRGKGNYTFKDIEIHMGVDSTGRITFQFIKPNFD